ncbi:MAG: hypothetical protein A2Y61_00355 [Chloroflexi bacterium RBG_13_60_13]|nr:MAG: hypothetical protein A2Y61_00355 [Chloroflexi bacterium RBG_13_60_13]
MTPDMPKELRLVCSWCHRTIREGSDGPDGPSHGICRECLEREYPDLANDDPETSEPTIW